MEQPTPEIPDPGSDRPRSIGSTGTVPSNAIQASSSDRSEYAVALERRVKDLEVEFSLIKHQLERVEGKTSGLEYKLPNTGMISRKFLTRAFTAWGHVFVAGLIIALPFYCIFFLLMMSQGGFR